MQKNRFIIAAFLVLLGSLLAVYVQTDGGNIAIHDVRFVGAAGNGVSGLLYVPRNAIAENPVPAILAVHGYINTRETQSGFAIEFARRGFVVLALDQTGHGYSDPPAFDHGFGGPDGLAYLRSLAFVDKDRIGLEGHSMGGWTVQMAAAAMPDGYAAMVLEGSSTGTFGAPVGTPDAPRNLLLVFSLFDEFSAFMWGAAIPADIVATDKLKALFGTDEDVAPDTLYGNIAVGNARKLTMPAVTHPGDHLSRAAIGAAVAWFQQTLGVTKSSLPQQQIWYWKEFGTLIALIGIVVLIFPVVDWLLGIEMLQGAKTSAPTPPGITTPRFVTSVVLAMFLPVATFFPLQAIANLILPANLIWPQQITNGVLLWAWGTGLIMLLLFWFRFRGHAFASLGVPRSASAITGAAGVALGVCAILYLVVVAADFFLHVDFRFWVIALKRPSAHQLAMILVYLPFFTLFFIVLSLSLHTELRRGGTLAQQMWTNGVILSGGFVLMLLVQYVPLLSGGTLALASQPLLTIVAFQFVPLLFIVGLVSTFCFARTNNIYTGAFINSLFITWYMVAGTATQALPFWMSA